MGQKKTYINNIGPDAQYNPAAQNLVSVATTNKSILGMDVTTLKELTDSVNAFGTQYTAAIAAKAAYKAAIATKDAQRKATEAIVGKYIKIWRANAAVPDALLDQMDVAPHGTPATHSAPTIPTKLLASSDGQGNITLSWKPNGNRTSTQYLIETRTSPSDAWTLQGATTKTKSTFAWPVGTYFAARLIAQRGNEQSLPTVPVVLWDNGSTSTLELAA